MARVQELGHQQRRNALCDTGDVRGPFQQVIESKIFVTTVLEADLVFAGQA
jgi:hypothetical protein